MKNRSVSPVESLESRIQLAADFSASLIAPVAGTVISVGVENVALVSVLNSGSESPREVRIGLALYASADDTLDPAGDLLLGTRTLSRMSAGESEVEDIEFVLPAGITPGAAYKLYAKVDHDARIAENDETNNMTAPVAVVFGGAGGGGGGGGGADLTVSLATPALPLVKGGEGKVFVSVANVGTAAVSTPVQVEVFVRSGETPDPTTDLRLGVRTFLSLSAGQTEVEDIEFAVPTSVATGTRVIYAVVDRADAVGESSETNNGSAMVNATFAAGGAGGGDDNGGGGDDGGGDDNGGGGDDGGGDDNGGGGDDGGGDDNGGGGGGGRPNGIDLGTALVTPASAFVVGTEMKVYASIFNNGLTSSTARTTVEVFMMAGETPNSATDRLVGVRQVSSVSAGENESEDIKIVFPANTPVGQYRLYAVIDRANRVVEASETNNVSEPVTVTLSPGVRDISGQIGRAIAPAAMVQGTSIGKSSVAFTYANNGTANFDRSAVATVRAYLRPVDAEDGSNDIPASDASRESLSSLTRGKSKSKELKLKVASTTPAGEYELIVKLDDGSSVSEIDESNNTLRTGRRIRIDMPTVDLSLVTPVFTASTRTGRPDLASVTVTNLGNSAFKGTSTVQFFYVDAEGVETAASSVISRRVDLKPGKTQKFDRVAMLARPTVVGEWTLVARVGGAAGDVNTDNNAVTVRTFTV
jgi:hypothetical protein